MPKDYSNYTKANVLSIRREGRAALFDAKEDAHRRNINALLATIGVGQRLADRVEGNREMDQYVRENFGDELEPVKDQNMFSRLWGGTRFRDADGNVYDRERLSALKFITDYQEEARKSFDKILEARKLRVGGDIREGEEQVDLLQGRMFPDDRMKIRGDE